MSFKRHLIYEQPEIYATLKSAYSKDGTPGRDMVNLGIACNNDVAHEAFIKNVPANVLLVNWMEKPSDKLVLSDPVYRAVDSDEEVRKYIKQFSNTPDGIGCLYSSEGSQHIYNIFSIPERPGFKYMSVLWVVGDTVMAFEECILQSAGMQLIEPHCLYLFNEYAIDKAQTLSFVLVFLNYLRLKPLHTEAHTVAGKAVTYCY